ncbi:hypothetical protein NQ317_018594 [Molorchus minor]|uniref:Catalase core domain-containing protein n=1 Tax=Molorchus minor TaxID=1323400 RepID=A0ABQ9JL03_9CUCU|nr:hypothetical protein NQ317_018594 [Molorchus minor]
MSVPKRDVAANQLSQFAKEHQNDKESITTTFGAPVGEKDASLTVGYHGPVLLQDWVLIDELAHFTRERIPERVVHAKERVHLGTSRFSQVAGELGYPDTVRDIRGFAIKFYTDDGIWDLVGNNQPVFFVKDFALFPSFIHVMKRNPKTHLRPDYDMFWDMITLRPETTHTTLIMFSDRGIPNSYRQMHGYGTNTYAFVNAQGTFVYCKFHWRSNQGVVNLSSEEAERIAGRDPDYHTRDLYNAIESADYPSWNFYIQVMTLDQAAKNSYDPFDDTKVWLHSEYPLIPVGRFVLNKNPKNYFAEIEQIGMDPAHLVPERTEKSIWCPFTFSYLAGIEPSPDRMLQGRLFAYADTHRYRLGPNYIQLPVNSPFKMHNYNRDGQGTVISQGGAPNYHPNTFNGPHEDVRAKALSPALALNGIAKRVDSGNDDNFTQSRMFYKNVLKADERNRLITNMLTWLLPTTVVLQERAVAMFSNVDQELGRRLREGLKTRQHVDL